MSALRREFLNSNCLAFLLSIVLILTSFPAAQTVVAQAGEPSPADPLPPPAPSAPAPDLSLEPASVSVRPDSPGTLVSADGKMSITIPAGAVTEDVQIVFTPSRPPLSTGMKMVKFFELKGYAVNRDNAEVNTFAKDLTVTIQHDPDELRGGDINSLSLYYLDEASKTWQPVPSSFDGQTQTLTSTVNHFTKFGEQISPAVSRAGMVMSFMVNLHSGAARSSYPIEIPPGPGGFQPKVELTYNSGAADEMKNKRSIGSWVGIGWDLSLGKISYDADQDRYYLETPNGSHELELVSNNDTYYTKPDAMMKVTRDGTKWDVWDASGVHYQFGGTDDSRQYYADSSNNTVYNHWDLSLMEDTHTDSNGYHTNRATVSYNRTLVHAGQADEAVRSAYPAYLRYSYSDNTSNSYQNEIEFATSYDVNDVVDGDIRWDTPRTPRYSGNNSPYGVPAPPVVETRKLDSIAIRTLDSGNWTLDRRYDLSYSSSNATYASDNGGIYYSGNLTLASITQIGADGTSQMPAMSFGYQGLYTRLNDTETETYTGNPGNPASFTWPHLTSVDNGYGGTVSFTYTEKPTWSSNDTWTREVVTAKTVNPGSVGTTQTYTYTYADGPNYVKPEGDDWQAKYRGFGNVTETDAAGNYVKHYFYAGVTSQNQSTKDPEMLVGREYLTEYYDSSGVLLQSESKDWTWNGSRYAWDMEWGQYGTGSGNFSNPWGISAFTLNSGNGTYWTYVADGHRLQKFDAFGTFMWAKGSYGPGDQQFYSPSGITVQQGSIEPTQGNVYVADQMNHRIQVLNADTGAFLGWIGKDSGGGIGWHATGSGNTSVSGSDNGAFNRPTGVTVGRDGYLYVADMINNRIQKLYSNNGGYVTSWGTSGTGDGQFWYPYDVAVDANNYNYVTDWYSSRIEKFDSSGNFQGWYGLDNAGETKWHGPGSGRYGVAGTGDGQFYNPRGLSAQGDGDIFVADTENNRIQHVSVNSSMGSSFIEKWGGTAAGSGKGQFNFPQDVEVNSVGYAYIAEAGNDRVQKYAVAQSIVLDSQETTIGSKTSRTRYSYDGYNNVIAEYYEGDTGSASDDYTVWRAYYPSTTSWILNKPARERVYSGNHTTDDGSGMAAQTYYYYDSGSAATPPTKGDLTRVERCLDSSNTTSQYYAYDVYGNRTQESDSANNTTTIDYDTTYHTYPVTVTFPTLSGNLSMTETYDYYYAGGKLKRDTDANSQNTSYYYDTFWRLTKAARPGDTEASPTVRYDYAAWGSPGSPWDQYTKVEQKVSDSGNYTWQRQFFDGLGRGIQTQAQSETSGYMIVGATTTYDNRGNVDKQYVSQNASASATYQTPGGSWKYSTSAYDALGRVTTQTSADGTSVSNNYSVPWETSVTNQRGYLTRYIYDAFSRLTAVKELGGDDYGLVLKWALSGAYRTSNDVALDSQGNVYVAVDGGGDGIRKYSSTGSLITDLNSYGAGDYQFNAPAGVAVDGSDTVYLADTSNHRIKVYSSNFSLQGWFGKGTSTTGWHNPGSGETGVSGTGDGALSSPGGVGTDSQGNVYVAESNRIQKFTSAGTSLGWYGSGNVTTGWHLAGSGETVVSGNTDGQFNGPSGVAIDGLGNLYVADSGNHRVQKISNSGTFLGWFGKGTSTTGWHAPGSGETGVSGNNSGEFNSPSGLAVSGDYYVYVTESGNDRVQKFSSNGTFVNKWGSYGAGDSQFNNPGGVAVAGDRYVYVADTGNYRVQKFASYATTAYAYDTLGNLTQVTDSANNTTTMTYDWLGRKSGMTDPDMGTWIYAYDKNGNLTSQNDSLGRVITFSYDALNRVTHKEYVDSPNGSQMTDIHYGYDDVTGGNKGRGRLTSMADAAGTATYSYDTRGRLTQEVRGIDGTNYTMSYTYDPADRLDTVTYPGGEVATTTYDDRGNPYSLSSSVNGSLVNSEIYNALGQTTALNYSNSTSVRYGYWGVGGAYDTAGGYYGRLWEIKTVKSGSPDLQDVQFTWDAGGNLTTRYDALSAHTENFGYDALDRLTSVSGNYTWAYAYNQIGNITSNNGTSYTYGTKPHAVAQVGGTSYAYDANGNMTTRGSQAITWDWDNKPASISDPTAAPGFTTKWGSQGSSDSQFNQPWGVAADSDGNIFVAETTNNRVQKFSSDGAFVTSWNGSSGAQFNSARDVAVGPDGYVYVVDYNNHRIQKFSNNGTYVTKWGSQGSANGEFYYPLGVAVSSDGYVYVADSYNYRIQKFSNNGTYVTQWGSYPQFQLPVRVAVSGDGYVYVADAYAYDNNIQKYSSNGTYVAGWGTYGPDEGEFDYPWGIAVDADGYVYVADRNNYRIQKFSSNGTFVTEWGGQGSGNGQFSYPRGVAVDGDGYVYVADTSNYRIQKFDPVKHYYYDGNGQRYKKTENGESTIYVGKYYEKEITSGNVTLHYYLGGQQVAFKKVDDLRWMSQDHLSGTSVVTNASGVSQGSMTYYPFGDQRNSTGSLGTDKLFTGQRLDNSGLYFYNARYYDAGIGRFISADTVIPSYMNPQSLNRYSYVYNNPLKYVDENGHFGFLAAFAAIGAAVGMGVYGFSVVRDKNKDFTWGGLAKAGVTGAIAGGMGGGFVGLGASIASKPLAFAVASGGGGLAGTAGYVAGEGVETVVNKATGQPDQGSPSLTGAVASFAGGTAGSLGGQVFAAAVQGPSSFFQSFITVTADFTETAAVAAGVAALTSEVVTPTINDWMNYDPYYNDPYVAMSYYESSVDSYDVPYFDPYYGYYW